ncbi:LysM peptidoglycan-binding domain-containing protein [Chryseobacterium sp. PS-8]|uniref:LysM peptidoglycan-binding domain-containing protein n=1 Tax=Chryseobacterium indicum TaxID=2766954 RepID=A0ABS9C3U4_9FLAO|nr:LysM peptidoglycan-binding domain-containing protein [Chryseobacterium sp. PS-8]MCF2218354.1 LysM peptidoglycan-binding domain-containing protein [Chryseobacterium sp. PS-8]
MGGKIKKLRITAYSDSTYTSDKKIGKFPNGADNPFYILINPTSFSINHKIEYNEEIPQGGTTSDPKHSKSFPPSLQLEFLFDGTGVTELNSGNTLLNKIKNKSSFAKTAVLDQIADFYVATGSYDGKIHKPYNVTINWGEFEYKGVLSEFTIDYKLFNNDGTPLRAIGKATFVGSVSQELEAARLKKSSPDLTHKRTVQAGDTLPLMTERIYGDSKYYLEVAKVNNLINFRQLKPGTELYFPPIEKIA